RFDIEQSALAKAFWINAGSTATQAVAIRFTMELPADGVIRSAMVDVASDGLATIYVNGHPTRQGPTSLTAPLHARITDQLVPGKNVFAIGSAAVRGAIRRDRGAVGRNAVAARAVIEFTDGRRLEFNTDTSWKSAVVTGSDWSATDFDDSK